MLTRFSAADGNLMDSEKRDVSFVSFSIFYFFFPRHAVVSPSLFMM